MIGCSGGAPGVGLVEARSTRKRDGPPVRRGARPRMNNECRRRDSNPRHADYDSARFLSVYGRFGRFWTADWTVLSDDWRFDGDPVVLAAGLELAVEGEHSGDCAEPVERGCGAEVDRI